MKIEDLKVGQFYTLKKGDIKFIFRYQIHAAYPELIYGDYFIKPKDSYDITYRLCNINQLHCICPINECKYISPTSAADVKTYYNINLIYHIKTTLL